MPVTKLAIESIDFFMRNVTMRLPFRYGNACLTATPILHTRLRARGEDGNVVTGVCADILPPKWFDKTADKTYRDNIEDLIAVAGMGANAYLAAGASPTSAFAMWQQAYGAIQDEAKQARFNGLTASYGPAIIERAVLDAAGQLAGLDYHRMVVDNRLGIEPGRVHAELDDRSLAESIAPEPLNILYIRHTVGLGDPILDSDIPERDRIDDGLPQSLEAWVKSARIRYFKIKVCADLETDIATLQRITELLEPTAPPDYGVSLDGNEQFKSGADLKRWLGAVSAEPGLQPLMKRVLFIEQPMERSVALTAEGADAFLGFEDLPPVAIDESDDSLDAFKHSVALGYRGTSVKNCKGVFKGIFNKMLVDHYNAERGGGYVLTGEDLSNQPLVPLQQDLCTLSVLGIPHAERNGQHYCGTLDHVSERELADALRVHGSLYEPFGRSARLRIRDGAIDLRSVQQVGYGMGMETDFDHMTPLNDWDYASLGIA